MNDYFKSGIIIELIKKFLLHIEIVLLFDVDHEDQIRQTYNFNEITPNVIKELFKADAIYIVDKTGRLSSFSLTEYRDVIVNSIRDEIT